MIRIEVNIDDDQLMDSLAALARQGEDASPIMRGLAGIMRSAAQDAFDMECDPVTGAAWPPLNEAYKKQRYADRYTGKTLNRTGDMRRSLSFYGRNGEKLVRKVVRHPGSAIPPRPFLGVGEDHKAEMRQLIVRHLRKAVRGA